MISVAQSDYQKLGQNLKANFGHINWASKLNTALVKGEKWVKKKSGCPELPEISNVSAPGVHDGGLILKTIFHTSLDASFSISTFYSPYKPHSIKHSSLCYENNAFTTK